MTFLATNCQPGTKNLRLGWCTNDTTKCTVSIGPPRILFQIHWFFVRLVWKSRRIQTTSTYSNHSWHSSYSHLWTIHWRTSCSKWSLQKRISSNEMLLSQAQPSGDALQKNEHALLQVEWIQWSNFKACFHCFTSSRTPARTPEVAYSLQPGHSQHLPWKNLPVDYVMSWQIVSTKRLLQRPHWK